MCTQEVDLNRDFVKNRKEMHIVKNRTPYVGKIRLRFLSKNGIVTNGIYNSTVINFGLFRLVSVMKPYNSADNRGPMVDDSKILLINLNTGLTVRDFMTKDEGMIYNAVLNQQGELIGDIEDGWWYYTNGLRCIPNTDHRVAWSPKTLEWVGYTHRGVQAFAYGDKLFEPDWVMTDDELREYERYYCKHLDQYERELTEWEDSDSPHKVSEEDMELNSWATQFIPFRLHGSKTIETYDDAYQAALNFAKYVS